jgi:S-adenosylmethionine hydrolase
MNNQYPIITLLTDFGIEDEYVGVMKGVILSTHPQAIIVDLTHQIPPHQVLQAAYILEGAYRYFPEGTIHVIVVDPGVGTDRKIIVLRKDGHVFIAPDNGVLTMILETGGIESIVTVENNEFYLKPVSRTFHGRDIFAPVAAHLSKGLPTRRLGAETRPDQLVRVEIIKPYISDKKEIYGSIVAMDRFGNLITDIDREMLTEFTGGLHNHRVIVQVSGQSIAGLSDGYEANDYGRFLALIGSRGYLEIAVCRGSAREVFCAQLGDRIKVSINRYGSNQKRQDEI